MADFCKTCKHCDIGEYDDPCFSCRNTGSGIPTKWEAKGNYKPQTNADRIRAMRDEELAEFLESTHTNMAINLGGDYIVRAKEYIEMWLKQPVE